MKLTEDIIVKAALNLRRDEFCNRFLESDIKYKTGILQAITGKMINCTELYITAALIKLTQKAREEYIEVFKEFCNKFDLTPAFNAIAKEVPKDVKSNRFEINTGFEYGAGLGFNEKISFQENSCEKVSVIPTMFLGDDLFLTVRGNSFITGHAEAYPDMIYYTTDKAMFVADMINFLKEKLNPMEKIETGKDEILVGIVSREEFGNLNVIDKYIKVDDISLDQFEDTLPNKKIVDELYKDRPGILIFHGEPGCGKSSYIKYLIKTCKDRKFIIISQDLFACDINSFRQLLLDVVGTNSVFIIEDCENLVKSREANGSNMVISDFLNITDGIYGDLFKIKFILTFNTDLKTIDPALLRKGRLKCKYQFGKLKGEKLKALTEKLGIKLDEDTIKSGMTLADIFNYGEDNGSEVSKTRIGF